MSMIGPEFEDWLREHGMVPAAPLPDKINGLILLIADAISRGRRAYLTEYLRELAQAEPDMPLSQFATHVQEALTVDLDNPLGLS